MVQHISGSSTPPPGMGGDHPSITIDCPMTAMQKEVIEKMLSNFATTSRRNVAHIRTELVQFLGVRSTESIQAKHFSTVLQYLKQQLLLTTDTLNTEQTFRLLTLMTDLIPGNQPILLMLMKLIGTSDPKKMAPEVQKAILNLFLGSELSITSTPQQCSQLLLKNLVSDTARLTGLSFENLWSKLLLLSESDVFPQISVHQMDLLIAWLNAYRAVYHRKNITLNMFNEMLPPEERHIINEYTSQHMRLVPEQVLPQFQVHELIDQLYLKKLMSAEQKVDMRYILPAYNALTETFGKLTKIISENPGYILILFIIILLMVILIS